MGSPNISIILLVFACVPGLLVKAVTDQCGVGRVTSRIVGGTNASDGSWPWQVSLQYKQRHICGGSLIAPKWVMTAAHCFDISKSPSVYTVVLGAYQLSTTNSHQVTSDVRYIVVNSVFDGTGSSGDIALIELSSKVTYTGFIRPVCLAPASITFPNGMDCWVTGWGTTSYGGSLAKTLQQVMVPLIDQAACNVMYNTNAGYNYDFIIIERDQICAGYETGQKDACQGDSGGPLVCSVQGVWYQVGIVSYGSECATPNRPGVYTLVSTYGSWINSSMISKSAAPAASVLLLVAALVFLLH
uniref:Peptidase S1 domain-containing protein n=1 Tax=Leptobrachium leishanense TaxID=445787 RepID=A0A8C5Q690_9ANUR